MESPKTVKHPNFLFMYHTNGIPYVSDDVMVRMRLTSFTQVDTVSLFFNVFIGIFISVVKTFCQVKLCNYS